MDDILTQTDPTRVRTYGDAEPRTRKVSVRCIDPAAASAAHLAAMRSTLSTSLTPARRHESIWQTSMASAWSSCLNTMRLCACSPVATPIPYGFRALRTAACPRISSGAVGSSMNLISEGQPVPPTTRAPPCISSAVRD